MTTSAQPASAATQRGRVVYPTSDGKPMAETDKHADLMVYCKEALRTHFTDRTTDVYISGNNFVFWEEGNPKARISPDVYVVFDVPMRPRDSFMSWNENGNLPSVVIEITSKKTHQEDTHTKLPLYERVLRIPEYFLFDPTGDYLRPRLQGYRLHDGAYVPLTLTDDRLRSERLGLDLVMEGERLRLYDPHHQRWLLTPQEQAARAEAAEAEVERLRAELAALKKQS